MPERMQRLSLVKMAVRLALSAKPTQAGAAGVPLKNS
jgi:hypothetical protein